MLAQKAKSGFSYSGITEDGVNFCTDEENVHAGIEPEHTKYNGGKAAVDGGVVAEIINIKGKKERESDPAGSSQNGSRQFTQNACFSVGKEDKNNQEEKNQYGNTDCSTQTDDEQGKLAEQRKTLGQPECELVTKYENQHHDEQKKGKYNRIEGCHDAGKNVISGFADTVDGVQTAHDRQDTAGSRPEGDDYGYGKNSTVCAVG